MTKKNSSPGSRFKDLHDAFNNLSTPDKAAFVIEATFDTIGQALQETGRHVSDAFESLEKEDWFRHRTGYGKKNKDDMHTAQSASKKKSGSASATKTSSKKKDSDDDAS